MIYPVNYHYLFRRARGGRGETNATAKAGKKIAQIVALISWDPLAGDHPPVPTETPELARRLAVGQTRTQSLFMCLRGERRLGVRLRRARGLMGTPRALQPNPQSSLTPKTHK